MTGFLFYTDHKNSLIKGQMLVLEFMTVPKPEYLGFIVILIEDPETIAFNLMPDPKSVEEIANRKCELTFTLKDLFFNTQING